MIPPPPRSTLFPYTTLFRSSCLPPRKVVFEVCNCSHEGFQPQDRKSTRLNSSHVAISYAVFCLKKKNIPTTISSSTCSNHILGCQNLKPDRSYFIVYTSPSC